MGGGKTWSVTTRPDAIYGKHFGNATTILELYEMRNFIEEVADNCWSEIKQYILDIKDYTHEELLNEFAKNFEEEMLVDIKEFHLNPNDIHMKEGFLERLKKLVESESKESLIAMAVEHKFYILTDDEEHEWNKHVVQQVLNGKTWTHRWDNVEML